MKSGSLSRQGKVGIIGVIPGYPEHSRYNIFGGIKMVPVGLPAVLSQINRSGGVYDVYAIDENNYIGPRDFTGMPDHSFLQKRNPAKIAMFYGGMTNSIPRLYTLAKQYHSLDVLNIAGGGHVSSLPEEALHSGVDIVVHGEGEKTGQEILEAIVEKGEVKFDRKKLMVIKGISLLDENGKYAFTGSREPMSEEELDNLEDTDLTLIRFGKRWTAIPINRGRGCNSDCEFCTVSQQLGPYRSSSPEKTLRQIIKYSDMGYKDFFITDDNFAQKPKEARDLCRMIGEYKREFNRKLRITVQVRSEIAGNDELIEEMKFAGVNALAIGFESPINEELKAMNKGVTVEQLTERARKLSDYFSLHGMFIFGYPLPPGSDKTGLTLEQKAKRYVNFFKESKIHTLQVLNAVPGPGSKLRKRLEEEKRILPLEMVGWDKYDGLFLCYDPRPEGIDALDLQNIPKTLMKSWYQGNVVSRKLNPGHWMNWAYNATVGFPIQFGIFYTKRFVHNLIEKKREKNIDKESLIPKKNVFHQSLNHAWEDITKNWRNLAIRTYAGEIVRNWFRVYKKSNYVQNLRDFLRKNRQDKIGN